MRVIGNRPVALPLCLLLGPPAVSGVVFYDDLTTSQALATDEEYLHTTANCQVGGPLGVLISIIMPKGGHPNARRPRAIRGRLHSVVTAPAPARSPRTCNAEPEGGG